MQRLDIDDLIKRYNAGIATKFEQELVEAWYLNYEADDLVEISETDRAADLELIWSRLPANQPKIRRIPTWVRVAAASIIVCFFAAGIYYYTHRNPAGKELAIETLVKDLTPGGNKAILTLSDGKTVVLTNAQIGNLATQSNTVISKTAEGKIVYLPGINNSNPRNTDYNTVSTPAGGVYNLTLSDGTNVTLDAASSIRYPVVFNGNERKVEITGQAYFEVAHNKAKPFKVVTEGQTVEVLGTHFNINAYKDEEATITTLLEGSVRVVKLSKEAVLKPGEQSVITANTTTINVRTADVEGAVAWKNGVFKFKRASLPTVMRQFSRWFDVEVGYEGAVPDVAITGKVLRAADASQVLKIVQGLGIKFKVEGRKIIILKNN